MKSEWINFKLVEALLNPEPAILVLILCLITYGFYRILLIEVSPERHKNLKGLFKNLAGHLIFASSLYFSYILILDVSNQTKLAEAILPYISIAALIWGIIVVIKAARILVLQYLFLGSMRAGVPLLIVNIFSLCLSLAIGVWFLNSILGIRLAPLVATSAALSVILGLAMQETLGNLFAAIAMQIDKPYEIGDWVEVYTGNQKIVGKVDEISWRSTLLVGWLDELIILPNRTMAQAQISNFTRRELPFSKSVIFRLQYNADVQSAKKILLRLTSDHPEVCNDPETLALVMETTESWIGLKLIFPINSYGRQNIIADQIFNEGWKLLKQAGIHPAKNQIELHKV